jgi:hypothetical protein
LFVIFTQRKACVAEKRDNRNFTIYNPSFTYGKIIEFMEEIILIIGSDIKNKVTEKQFAQLFV